jgi:tellurite resistance protein TerC
MPPAEIPGRPLALWLGCIAFVVAMLALDLGVFHRRAHVVRAREAVAWWGIWIALALLFNLGLLLFDDRRAAVEFFTGYLIEASLSVDNLFVFLVLFQFFSTPPVVRHRVLFWGIVGALAMRGVMIGVGTALLARFEWILAAFGVLLLLTGGKLFFTRDRKPHPERNPIVRLVRRSGRLTPDYEGTHFFVRRVGKWFATPLFLVLVAVETTDVLFAVDSIPAVFGITRDPFIVFASNAFAILGLRSIFFALSSFLDAFRHLDKGVALVLVFIGGKMLVEYFAEAHLPVVVSLCVVAAILAASVLASLPGRSAKREEQSEVPS